MRGGESDPLIPLTTNYTFIWPKMTYSLDTQRVGHFLFYRQTQIGGTTWMRRLWKMEYCYSTLGFRQLCKRNYRLGVGG